MRVSVASDADTEAYLEAIKLELRVWAAATGGRIGTVEIGRDLLDADLSVRVGPHHVYDCSAATSMWCGIFADGRHDPPRILRDGGIYICPWNFQAVPSDVLRVAHVVGHEMGHALGITAHSSHPTDLMYGDDVAIVAPSESYPWVTDRDLNTLGTAYWN